MQHINTVKEFWNGLFSLQQQSNPDADLLEFFGNVYQWHIITGADGQHPLFLKQPAISFLAWYIYGADKKLFTDMLELTEISKQALTELITEAESNAKET